jgi:hypothetical protein
MREWTWAYLIVEIPYINQLRGAASCSIYASLLSLGGLPITLLACHFIALVAVSIFVVVLSDTVFIQKCLKCFQDLISERQPVQTALLRMPGQNIAINISVVSRKSHLENG